METNREVAHYEVTVEGYQTLVNMLSRLPYNIAAGPLQVLTENTRAIFQSDDPPGGPVDPPDPEEP